MGLELKGEERSSGYGMSGEVEGWIVGSGGSNVGEGCEGPTRESGGSFVRSDVGSG